MSGQRKSCSFEISFDERDVSSVPKPQLSAKKAADTPKKDITVKMEEVSRRKSDLLQHTRERCEAHHQHVKSVIEELNAKRDSLKIELIETSEMKDELASMRRRQTLEDKIESAKKDLERVDIVRKSLAEETERKKNELDEDMANKENNRRSLLMSVKETCQSELEKVESARLRRTSMTETLDE
ncbi:unnamed protein product [Rodentolepis nana]|uniref:Myosin_tail_1 domain-containing protein n=1 Tax=Rodentolepis nana TaxID=102285 RepID=A0A0R3TAH6_RODNA|nr:unnamed protein product [Rodentolepis nana]